MDTLSVEHKDFVLSVVCDKYAAIRGKAIRNISENAISTTYSFSDEINSAVLNGVQQVRNNEKADALFFDNADYAIWIEFDKSVTSANYASVATGINEKFHFRESTHTLFGNLNFGNEIGKTDIAFDYIKNGQHKHFCLTTEVLSTKLDYHVHWKHIISDIEEEYRMLSLDFLRRTYHGISLGDGESMDIIWWNVFREVSECFIKSCRQILDRPRHKLRPVTSHKRADQIRHFTPILEQRFAEHKNEEAFLYQVQTSTSSNNTLENRFFKHTVNTIANKFHKLASLLKSYQAISEAERKAISDTDSQLRSIRLNPFFRTVGPFEGLKQESQILQNDTNYHNVLRTSIILNKSFQLNDGLYRMETKDIATLYEIWCLIMVARLVKETLGDDVEVVPASRTELSPIFHIRNLVTGQQSQIIFKKGDVQLAQVIYNPKHEDDDESIETGIENLVSKTVPQKPDIVLQLTKDDIEDNMKLTYLFDAKYRIDSRDGNVDTPPDDAINQMHRYRDAIFYSSENTSRLKREVIGGYILFPGVGTTEDVAEKNFYKSIEEVNIGAFPLRPGDEGSHELLRKHLRSILIDNTAYDQLKESIPQKGLDYNLKPPIGEELVLVGYAKDYSKIVEKNLYYVRTGDAKGSIHLVPGFEWTRWVFLYNKDQRILLELKDSKPMLYTKQQLAAKMEMKESEFHSETYFVFELIGESHSADLTQVNIDFSQKNFAPYFKGFKELFK